MITEDTTEQDQHGGQYTFPASLLPTAAHKIDLANRRLARNGITERFTYTTMETLVAEQYDDGGPTGRVFRMVNLTLSAPQLCLAGWTFIATLVHEQAGVIARTVPGQSLNGHTPNVEQTCDHCHTNRSRKDTYVVRHDDGTVRQVGSNCLAAFLGIKPAGLWALGFELEIGDDDEAERGPWGSRDYLVDVRQVIAYTLAASDNGRAFRSVASCEFGGVPTVSIVRDMLNPPSRMTTAQRAELDTLIGTGNSMDPALVDAVLEAARTIDGDSDYAHNMRVLAASEHVDDRNLGMLASAVGAWNRAEGRKAEQAAKVPAAAGYLAPVGAKLTGVPVTVTGVHQIEGQWGWTTIIAMTATTTGHHVKWFATGALRYEVGASLVITSARVKGHDQYQGTDETVITRAKLAEVG